MAKKKNKAPPFVQIAAAGRRGHEMVWALDKNGRVWRLVSDGWALHTANVSAYMGEELEDG